jgi:hypothetical protein
MLGTDTHWAGTSFLEDARRSLRCYAYFTRSGQVGCLCVCEEVHRRDNILTVCVLFGYSQVKFLLPPLLVQKANDRSEYLSKNVKLGLNNMTTIYHILGDGSEAATGVI